MAKGDTFMFGRLQKHLLRLSLLGLAMVIPTGLRAAEIPTVEVSGKIRWVYDYEQGKRLARQNGKPMFVVFRCER
jgi:hypothetical protein